ncbi:hypothetical protein [uncultured Parolsenella sp.]|uniref:hypothetical protein n=1 Tax=uncultured Parolsenella sp. TaxID=2083008 RepID=UPI0025EC6F8C|nr:hypothetical protein [uncultured Parolsenella sp.]
MRKDKFAVIAAIVGIIFAIGLVGCGDSGDAESKAAIADGVTDGLEQLKSGSGEAVDLAKETLNSYVGSQLEDMGISDDELISTYLQDFDYEVGDVTMTGSSATVHVTLTCRSVADIAKEFVSQSRGLNDEEAGKVLMQCVENATPAQSEADVYVQKGADGSWDTLGGLKSALVKLCV